MLRKIQGDEYVGEELTWCVENGVLPNTRYTLEGSERNKVYSSSEIGIIFSNLLNQLFDSKSFVDQFRKDVLSNVPVDVVKDEAQKDSTIHEALCKDIQSLGYKESSAFDVFYSLISDVLIILEFKEHNLKNVVENNLQNQIITKKNFAALKVFRIFVHKVLKTAVDRIESEKNILKVDCKWVDDVYVDTDLVSLLNCGSASGIYNRIRFTLSFNKKGTKGPEIRNLTGYHMVKATLMVELGKLSASRQIVFTRLLNYLSRLINIDDRHLYSHLVVKTEYNLNVSIWNLVYSAIEDSGIKRLYYDDHNFIKYLYKLNARGMSVLRLFRILEYNSESYIGNEQDFELLKSNIDKQKYFEDTKRYYNDSSFTRLVYKTKGVSSFESRIYEI
ncbi:conserved hypothetical protein [Theileria orientalis strain Shintoku]|uniref:Uncharacterized protein n=1 Tax=Theileria orientalis strain Shintoku TaxID=869250 RepID=J4C479_THEOR|nr:conserved hypothetical protein [Theileria orientalis strain Shintoku]BAM41716.1 conserved hypothetical protein [Theileria orientalis strain Shintoku]|eukprot:XP_009692017.1 conserved hypothetical protein [Theileria orientalis strain Shintoku]